MIVSNPLLKLTNIILFLNKIDILRSKLASGIKLRNHVVSYGDRPNDVDSSTACWVFFIPSHTFIKCSNAVRQISNGSLVRDEDSADECSIDVQLATAGILNERSPLPRIFYCHCTTVTVCTWVLKQPDGIFKLSSGYQVDEIYPY